MSTPNATTAPSDFVIPEFVPDFFIVGAAKSGTTSLHSYLNDHPGIFLPPDEKEPGFFCDLWGYDDPQLYSELFADAGPDQLTGEASTPYLTCPGSAEWIHAANPKAKIIVALRNPADRAFSLYQQMVKQGHETCRTFEDALAAEKERQARPPVVPGYYYNYLYFESGLYAKQVERYLDAFDRDQIHFVLMDELRQDAHDTINRTLQFLGLEGKSEFEPSVHNPRQFPRSIPLQHFLKRCVEDPSRSLGFFPGKWLAFRLKNWNLSKGQKPSFLPETRQKLVAAYRSDVELTSTLIGKDLSAWMTSSS